MAAGTNDPSARMQFGVALAQKGKDAEALTEFLWCFDHGLEAGPAFTGVRLSFLLMDIKNLAAHYPPAQQALETRRDERQAKVAAGSTDFQTIQDLVSLNKALGQETKNLAVFDQLPLFHVCSRTNSWKPNGTRMFFKGRMAGPPSEKRWNSLI